MTRKRHTGGADHPGLKNAQASVNFQDLCRKHGFPDATFFEVAGAISWAGSQRHEQLEEENRRLKQMVAKQAQEVQVLKALTAKNL